MADPDDRTEERVMRYCKRMNRTCSCGQLVTYDGTGNIREISGGAGCMTDSEIRSVLTVLLREWRRRCMEAELPSSQIGYH
jgi:hypothetical protein